MAMAAQHPQEHVFREEPAEKKVKSRSIPRRGLLAYDADRIIEKFLKEGVKLEKFRIEFEGKMHNIEVDHRTHDFITDVVSHYGTEHDRMESKPLTVEFESQFTKDAVKIQLLKIGHKLDKDKLDEAIKKACSK